MPKTIKHQIRIGARARIAIAHKNTIQYTLIGTILFFMSAGFILGFLKSQGAPAKLMFIDGKKNGAKRALPRYLIIVFLLIAVYAWVFLITTPEISLADQGNLLTTSLIVPAIGYLIFVVKGDK